jgi:uncharacterized RDD family membrane protein YckC
MESTSSPLPGPARLPKKVLKLRPAGFFSRVEAFIIDLLILSIVQLVSSALIKSVLGFFKLTGLAVGLRTLLANSIDNLTIGGVITSLFVIGYFTFCWSLVGYTPGKALLGLRVVHMNGTHISYGRSLLRFFAYWISAIPLFLGFFWVLWDPDRQGWHDKIAGTQVLYVPKKPHK